MQTADHGEHHMRRLGRLAMPLAALSLLMAATACTEEEPKPPPPGARLCGITMASWWFDATGGKDLSGELRGDGLPLTNPGQSRSASRTAICDVSAGGKSVGRFIAEVTTADEVIEAARSIDLQSANRRFTVAGGKGSVDPNVNDDGADAWWTCKSALLNVEVYRPRDVKKRIELTRTLGRRVAAVVGCPGPVPVLPAD
ncbi:hypothetical protein [Streptomyces sp. NPDC058371]|uniref:hypothetical protein n=1 Tax=Streptomyces sp. NPDC058371 TaxID=3346463 RepID=UPI003659FEE9